MRPLTKLFILVLLLGSGFAPEVQAQELGNCNLGQASQDLDINNVRARLFNKGNLFYNGGTPLYEVPAGSGISPIFAGGIWIGGTVGGQVRTAAATYAQGNEDYEFYPGPLTESGTLPNPDDCSGYDRMFKVSVTDIAEYESSGNATPDLEDWPTGLGAPTCIDQNEDGRCAPEEPKSKSIPGGTDYYFDLDGNDEFDDGEPRVAGLQPDGSFGLIELGAGQIPDILGDQGIWWVMNDLGNIHRTTLSPPMGMEVQVLAFAVSRGDALGDATFYKYTFVYRGQQALENTFLTIWSDPDLGNFSDDYIGNAPELGLGFVYNSDNDDEASAGGYGVNPPALGYDFFIGPVTDADGDGVLDTLSMTKFGYYNNNADPRSGNPDTFDDYYNYMRGLWRDGTPWTEGGEGLDEASTPVDFVYPNSGSQENPTPGYWSEVCPQPECDAPIPPDDRRFIMSTGPFTMQPGDRQEVIYGIVWAQGADNFASIQAVKTADVLAQRFFDLEFQIASPPPAPSLEAAVLSGNAAIRWSYPSSGDPKVTNYLGGYEREDPLIAGLPGVVDDTYNFEGFNIYQYPSESFADADRELIAVYDIENGITTIIDERFDPETGDENFPFVAARGTDSGLQFYHIIEEGLINYRDYYYGVTAYAYNEESTPDVVESQAATITIRPADIAAASGGSEVNAELGNAIQAERVGGPGSANVFARVIDPTEITGDRYRVEFVSIAEEDEASLDSLTYRVINEDSDQVEFDGVEAYNGGAGVLVAPFGRAINVDGLALFTVESPQVPELDADNVPDFAGDGIGIVEVAAPPEDQEPCVGVPEDPAEDGYDPGCAIYEGNTVWLDSDRNGDYAVTNPDNDLGDLSSAIGVAAPDDFEMRFTQECASGDCLGVYASALPGGNDFIASVPFELWNVGNASSPDLEDDVRMIPVLRAADGAEETSEWEDTFPVEQEVIVGSDTLDLPVTQRVLWMMPDRQDGYQLFEAAARGFGGPGATYDPEDDGDMQVDSLSNGQECRRQGYYIDFCYRDASTLAVIPIGGIDGMQLADVARDGTTPQPGTVIRFLTVPKALLSGRDVLSLNTSDFGFVTGSDSVATDVLGRIGIVPNPYRGFSVYETGNLDRRVRFINLPDQATIRIFTLSGTLIRTLQANNTRSFDWNLETESGLPVASGMYLVHVDTPAGEVVLKLAVVNRESRFEIF